MGCKFIKIRPAKTINDTELYKNEISPKKNYKRYFFNLLGI